MASVSEWAATYPSIIIPGRRTFPRDSLMKSTTAPTPPAFVINCAS